MARRTLTLNICSVYSWAMERRPVVNPPVRFRDVLVSYDEGDGPPPAKVTLLEDASRSILSRNDSPDLDFRWSANPYRGCLHACSYCVDGETRILMADGRHRRMADIRVGDEIYGTEEQGSDRRYKRTRVLAHWTTLKLAYRIRLADGTELIASGDHRFLSDRGWKHVVGDEGGQRPFLTTNNRLIGTGLFHTARKRELEGHALENPADLRVMSIEPLGLRQLFDITTGTSDFIANGVVSHNCYARPTHEYLDLGAGTDFDTKIVVKRNAPELLREAFDKPSWKGELVMFSGVTDCYQPIEKELELTRKLLEVCAEYRNPVSVISKSALIERDIDLFQTLVREARFHIYVSLAFTDNAQSRAIEPWASSPERRFKVIETLAKAGIPVGVMVAPVIPGVNDRQVVGVLERAAAAGATRAGWVLLRLPGAVKEVFELRIREAMPLAADKVLSRIRDTRGGEQLYDARFHTRGRGQGPYADTIAMMFDTTIARLGMNVRDRYKEEDDADEASTFRRPAPRTGQLSLF
ncbi:MAG: radical SAM protein [Kofleriaceae bacterium]|nr:radical SAM protein [Kofleriaceae bacterium]